MIDWRVFLCEASIDDVKFIRGCDLRLQTPPDVALDAIVYGVRRLQLPMRDMLYKACIVCPVQHLLRNAAETMDAVFLVELTKLIYVDYLKSSLLTFVIESGRKDAQAVALHLMRAGCRPSHGSALSAFQSNEISIVADMFRLYAKDAAHLFGHIMVHTEEGSHTMRTFCDHCLSSLSARWRTAMAS